METSSSATHTDTDTDIHADSMPKLPVVWRVAAWAGLTGLLAVGFLGYFLPGMRLNWEAIAAMCGF